MNSRVRIIDVVTVALWTGCLVLVLVNVLGGSPIPGGGVMLGLAALASTQVSLATWMVRKIRIDHAVQQLDDLISRRERQNEN
jgi:hypothetical protein